MTPQPDAEAPHIAPLPAHSEANYEKIRAILLQAKDKLITEHKLELGSGIYMIGIGRHRRDIEAGIVQSGVIVAGDKATIDTLPKYIYVHFTDGITYKIPLERDYCARARHSVAYAPRSLPSGP
jgi:hypothetical protein